MRLSLIVAVAQNGVIGCHGNLPWHLSADLRRFQRTTMGHALIMGRKTFQSIGRPLPGRRSVVISRNPECKAKGCRVVSTWTDALHQVETEEEAFVIGGHQVFVHAMPSASRLFWTQVHADVKGDVFFPPVDWDLWQMILDEHHPADKRNEYAFSFREFVRVEASK